MRPMTAAELADRLPVLVEGYAEDLYRSGRRPTRDAALEEAERQTRSLMPDGVDSPDTLVFVGEDGGRPVGWIWLGLPNATNGDAAWIYNVEVDEGQRGRGYGRALMLAAEDELTRRGVARLRLNVFGDNAVARRLYESLGYRVAAQQMVKPLG